MHVIRYTLFLTKMLNLLCIYCRKNRLELALELGDEFDLGGTIVNYRHATLQVNLQ